MRFLKLNTLKYIEQITPYVFIILFISNTFIVYFIYFFLAMFLYFSKSEISP